MPQPVSNPPNPYESRHVEWLGPAPIARLTVLEERAKSIVSENQSPDIPFRYSVNPYRGCQHACAYCYARPTHQYLSLGAGSDFDKRIVVKTNAPALLRKFLARRSWKQEAITFSGNTDCYQPLEASYGLTRGCLEACLAHANPVAIITKGALIRRDAELLSELARVAGARVFVSIPFADSRTCRLIEPGAPSPADRFETLRVLSQKGISTGVAIAPLIPGLNESDIPTILQRAQAAGAQQAFMILLRLAGEVETIFRERLEEVLPGRAAHVFSALGDTRARQSRPHAFGERMHGRGARWDSVQRLFEVQCRRLGLNVGEGAELRPLMPRASARQGSLFEEA